VESMHLQGLYWKMSWLLHGFLANPEITKWADQAVAVANRIRKFDASSG